MVNQYDIDRHIAVSNLPYSHGNVPVAMAYHLSVKIHQRGICSRHKKKDTHPNRGYCYVYMHKHILYTVKPL